MKTGLMDGYVCVGASLEVAVDRIVATHLRLLE